MTKLYIKNMVCNRCIMVVTDAVEKLGVKWLTVNLGEVEFAEPLSGPQLEELRQNVEKLGFEILDDPRSEEHTSELQSRPHLVCRLLLEKKNYKIVLPFLDGSRTMKFVNCLASRLSGVS